MKTRIRIEIRTHIKIRETHCIYLKLLGIGTTIQGRLHTRIHLSSVPDLGGEGAKQGTCLGRKIFKYLRFLSRVWKWEGVPFSDL